MKNDETLVRLPQGLDSAFGDCRVGVVLVRKDEAVLSVRPKQAGGPRVQMTVRPGEVVPIDGALHRVVEVHHADGKTVLPGGSKDYVVIDSAPVELASLELHAGSLAIPLGATANGAGYDLEVISLGADATAQLEVWPDEFAKPQTKPALIKSFAVKGGATIAAGPGQVSIVSVVPPNTSSGLRGFVEVGW
ncbi:MAG: hypothetical protein Q8L48_20245 [Archangium sp.]|nr:hypothetical protein [Archangium sp.]